MQKFFGMAILSLLLLIMSLPIIIVSYPEKEIVESLPELSNDPNIEIKVYNHSSNKIELMNLEEYLIGVVAAEMPANFHQEALKAQAIAARTYALKRVIMYRQGSNNYHPGADICTDFAHAQAWIDTQQMKKNWGESRFEGNYNRIKTAVLKTKGQIVLYNGKMIDPVFHADCGGTKTENAEEVWQSSAPYLTTASCLPRQDTNKSIEEKVLSLKQVDVALGTNLEAVPASTLTSSNLVKITDRTKAGRVKSITLGRESLEGTKVRQALGLKSTNFELKISDGKAYITTIGNGHGVGLCQVGANEFAKKGKNYKEILTHYYKGVKLVTLSKK